MIQPDISHLTPEQVHQFVEDNLATFLTSLIATCNASGGRTALAEVKGLLALITDVMAGNAEYEHAAGIHNLSQTYFELCIVIERMREQLVAVVAKAEQQSQSEADGS